MKGMTPVSNNLPLMNELAASLSVMKQELSRGGLVMKIYLHLLVIFGILMVY